MPGQGGRRARVNTRGLLGDTAPSQESGDELRFLLRTDDQDLAQVARSRGHRLLYLSPDVVDPDPDQVRRQPSLDQLLTLAQQGDVRAQVLVQEMRTLGQSIADHGQLTPVLVYAYHDPAHPAITHRLIHGYRRRSAIILHELPTIWVVEVAQPSRSMLLLQQVDENERRLALNDMQLSWAVSGLYSSMQEERAGPITWAEIEQALHISESRRKDLLRLQRFPLQGQETIAYHGWSEWTLRPITIALQENHLSAEDGILLLQHIAELPPDQVSKSVVQRLVTHHTQHRAASPNPTIPAAADVPEGFDPGMERHLQRLQTHWTQFTTRSPSQMSSEARAAVRSTITKLRDQLEAYLQQLDE